MVNRSMKERRDRGVKKEKPEEQGKMGGGDKTINQKSTNNQHTASKREK